KFNETREIQWKFNIAMWGLITAAIYFFEKREQKTSGAHWWIIILSIVFFLAHFLFIRLTQRSLGVSKLICKNILEQLNDNKPNVIVSIDKADKEYRTGTDAWWITFQLTATAVLIITLLALNL